MSKWCLSTILVIMLFGFGISLTEEAYGGQRRYGLIRLEKSVMNQIKLLRSNPARYSYKLRNYEGSEEAVRVLKSTEPLPVLKVSAGLCKAAKDYVNDQGPIGGKGHIGTDGSKFWERANRYGTDGNPGAENISYGKSSAEEIIISWLIDAKTPSRGHRKNLLNPDYNYMGVGCGYHSQYDSMCVLDLAVDYKDR